MPREKFSIVVECLNRTEDETAIATAASYLAYADQSDTIGYAPAYEDVRVYSNDAGPLSVTFEVSLSIENDEHLKEFMDEMAHLSRVLSVERGVTA